MSNAWTPPAADRSDAEDRHAEPPRGALQLRWRADYESGHAQMDEQHRRLFELATALIDAAAGDGPDPVAIRTAFEPLLEHVAHHFHCEEALLRSSGYEHGHEHALAHAALLQRALHLKREADQGSATFGTLVDFLANDVVARHLLLADRAWFAYVGATVAHPGRGPA